MPQFLIVGPLIMPKKLNHFSLLKQERGTFSVVLKAFGWDLWQLF